MWRRSVGPSIDHSPLVTPEGHVLAFTARGDVIELGADGTEKRRVGLGAGPLSAGALLADGTLVTMTTAGEAVGVRLTEEARIRFRTRVGDRGMLVKAAPLPLDDGGVVVANATRTGSHAEGAVPGYQSEMVILDADGTVRSRVTLPLAFLWPLVATRAGIAAIGADGSVYLWARASMVGSTSGEPIRIGSFGGLLDGGAAALDDSTLVAVVDARRVVSLDLVNGVTKVLTMTGGSGAFLGPPSIADGTTHVLEATATGTRLVAIDRAGSVSAYRLSTIPGGVDSDGGVTPLSTPVHTATLVDGSGRVAFAGPDGHVGVFSAGNVADLGEVICGRGTPPIETSAAPSSPPSPHSVPLARPSAGFAGLAPAGPGTFLVACEGGTLLEVGRGD